MKTVKLETLEYNIEFVMKPHKFANRIMLSIILTATAEVKPLVIKSIETSVEKLNVVGLCNYMLNHVENIKLGDSNDADRYFDYDQLFSAIAYVGQYNSETDKCTYSMLFLVNTGFPANSKRIIWSGGNILLNDKIINRFSDDIKNTLKEIELEV